MEQRNDAVGGLAQRPDRHRLRRWPPWFALLFPPGSLVLASLLATCAILLRYSFNHWDPSQTAAIREPRGSPLVVVPRVGPTALPRFCSHRAEMSE
jgi:hypothetical protein